MFRNISAISYQLSAISYQLPATSYQLLKHQSSPVSNKNKDESILKKIFY
jgi:hypothetical protein